MVLQFDVERLRELAKSVGLVTRITPAHAGTGAQLRKAKAALKALIFCGDEAIIEIDVVGDEDTVTHELHEAIRHLHEQWRVSHHIIGDTGERDYPGRNRPLEIEKGVPLPNNLVVADLDDADFGDAVPARPTSGRLDVYNVT